MHTACNSTSCHPSSSNIVLSETTDALILPPSVLKFESQVNCSSKLGWSKAQTGTMGRPQAPAFPRRRMFSLQQGFGYASHSFHAAAAVVMQAGMWASVSSSAQGMKRRTPSLSHESMCRTWDTRTGRRGCPRSPLMCWKRQIACEGEMKHFCRLNHLGSDV